MIGYYFYSFDVVDMQRTPPLKLHEKFEYEESVFAAIHRK